MTSSATRLRCLPARSVCCRRRASAPPTRVCTSRSTAAHRSLAGKGVADPYGAILSVAMLLRHSLHRDDLALGHRGGGRCLHRRGRAPARPRWRLEHGRRRRRGGTRGDANVSARRSDRRHEHRDLRHHASRRRPGRRHQLLRVRQAPHRRAPRHARGHCHRGRMAGRESHRHRILRGDAHAPAAAPRRSRRSARPGGRGFGRRTTCRCARSSARWRRSSRWSARPGTARSSTCCAPPSMRTSR